MTGRSLNDQDICLLKFNYENLHESVWENHKTSWIVTSIFIPIIFAMQGYFIKDYFSALNTSTTGIPIVPVFMGAVVIQSLAFVWWLIMRIFSRYNEGRLNRLKEIENIFDTNNTDPVQQYKLHYTLRYMQHWGKRVDWIKHRKCLFSWDNVPGNDSERLMRCIKDDYGIGWVESVEIRKSGDGKTIHISMDENSSAEITVDETEENATLKISDGRTQSIDVKKENGKLNIYKHLNKNHCGIKITFDRVCNLILAETSLINLSLIYLAYT